MGCFAGRNPDLSGDPGNQGLVIQMSEIYFDMANDVVGTAEFYLEQETKILTSLELVMVTFWAC